MPEHGQARHGVYREERGRRGREEQGVSMKGQTAEREGRGHGGLGNGRGGRRVGEGRKDAV